MAVAVVTVIVAVPICVVSWVDVAVTVTLVLAVTACAVNTPLTSMVPPLAPPLIPHVTVVAKLPVPVTVAVHWLVWPDSTVAGLHVTVTPVIAELLVDPPPQAIIPTTLHKAKSRARARKLISLDQ